MQFLGRTGHFASQRHLGSWSFLSTDTLLMCLDKSVQFFHCWSSQLTLKFICCLSSPSRFPLRRGLCSLGSTSRISPQSIFIPRTLHGCRPRSLDRVGHGHSWPNRDSDMPLG